MKRVRPGSILGETPAYLASTRSVHAPTIRELLDLLEHTEPDARAIDPVGLRQYFDRKPDGERTCFQNARLLPAGADLYADGAALVPRRRDIVESRGSLLDLLERVLAEQLSRAGSPVVALSGGLDSALVLALVRRLAGNAVPAVTLVTRFPGYCEREETLATARMLGVESVDVIEAGTDDFLDALPDAIAGCETPLFNLHPVSKLLLARAVAKRGHDALITGDGADQVFAGADARNYLPIVGALIRATGIALLSPFLDERIVGWAKAHVVDPGKTELRCAASGLLPAELVWRRKSPRLAPDFDLNLHRDGNLEARLGPRLGMRPCDATSGPQRTLWATTAILVRQLRGTC